MCIILQTPSDFTAEIEVSIALDECIYPSRFDEESLVQCGWRTAVVPKTYTSVINDQKTTISFL